MNEDIIVPALKDNTKEIGNHRFEEANELYSKYIEAAKGDQNKLKELISSSDDIIRPFVESVLYNRNPGLFFDFYGSELGPNSLRSLRHKMTVKMQHTNGKNIENPKNKESEEINKSR